MANPDSNLLERKLKAKWLIEAQEDFQAWHGDKIPIDREALRRDLLAFHGIDINEPQ